MNDNTRSLVRYNFRALMGNSYWLIVVPIAASQLLVLWNMAVASTFKAASVAKSVELVMPILGAFLAAHTLGVEYRSRIGAVLVAKPLPVQRALLVRLGLIALFLVALLLSMLLVYRVGVGEFSVLPTLLAGVPPTLFLAMLALTMATALRNSLVGFLVAAGYWGLEVLGGVGMNPLLTLQSYSGMLIDHPLARAWIWNKIGLMVLGLALFEIHRRSWLRPEAPVTRRRRVRQIVGIAALLLLYVYSGAAYKVVYARSRPFGLRMPERQWLRLQFSIYGPMPVAWLFGPAFARYLGHATPWRGGAYEIGSLTGDSTPLVQMLRSVPEQYPQSVWADPARYEYAQIMSTKGRTEAGLKAFRELADLRPNSDWGLAALSGWLTVAERAKNRAMAREAAQRILRDRPQAPAAYLAGTVAAREYRGEGRLQDALQAAETAARVAGPLDRPVALALCAELLRDAGRLEEARARARTALNAANGPFPGVDSADRAHAEPALAEIRSRMDQLSRGR